MEKEYVSQTTLDQLVSSDRSQLLKAVLPYLPLRGQRFISVYTKVSELSNTLALFSPDRQELTACTQSAPAASPLDMLQDIRRFCYGNSRRQLDQMVNMMAAMEIMQLMKEGNTGGNAHE